MTYIDLEHFYLPCINYFPGPALSCPAFDVYKLLYVKHTLSSCSARSQLFNKPHSLTQFFFCVFFLIAAVNIAQVTVQLETTTTTNATASLTSLTYTPVLSTSEWPTPAPETDGYKYMGFWQESAGALDDPIAGRKALDIEEPGGGIHEEMKGTMTAEKCLRFCKSGREGKGYKIAGLENARLGSDEFRFEDFCFFLLFFLFFIFLLLPFFTFLAIRKQVRGNKEETEKIPSTLPTYLIVSQHNVVNTRLTR